MLDKIVIHTTSLRGGFASHKPSLRGTLATKQSQEVYDVAPHGIAMSVLKSAPPRNDISGFVFFCILLLLILFPLPSLADISKEKLPLPRFVTIKFDEVNARTGPAVDCPIEWVFIRKGEPVEIIAEYEQWRKIRDVNGEGGWIHSSALSAKRSVIIVAKNVMPLIGAPGNYDDVIAKLNPKLRCNLVKCREEWCQIVCKSYKGWISRKFLWGVYPDE